MATHYSFNAPLIAGRRGPKGDKGDTGSGVTTASLAGGKNWFDKTNYIDQCFIASNGVLNTTVTAVGYRTSQPIPVVAGDVWTLSGGNAVPTKRYRFLDSAGAYLASSVGNVAYPLTLTVPVGAAYFQFTFKHSGNTSSVDWDTVQFEKGAIATSFEAYIPNIYKIDGNVVRNADKNVYSQAETQAYVGSNAKIPMLEIFKNGTSLSIRTRYNDTKDCVHSMSLTNNNNVPVLTSVKIINSTDPITTTGTQIHAFSDNTPPLQFTYLGNLGGSHGVEATQVNATSHGKTSADVTARYTDGTYNYRITEILDANTLVILSEPYTETNGEQALRQGSIVGSTLTYLSGGTSTTNISVSSTSTLQRYPSTKNVVITLRVDGRVISADGTYRADLFEVVCSHDVIDPSAMVFTAPQVYNNAPALASVNVVYSFRINASMQLDTTINVLRNHKVINFGLLQVQKTTVAGALTNRIVYMPNVTGKVVGSNTYNFVSKVDMTNDPPASIYIVNADLTDGTKPTDRQVQLLTNSSLVPQHGHAHGYDIQAGNGKYASRLPNTEVWYISTANKSYPRAYAGRLTNGDVVYGTAYSVYFDPATNPQLTACYYITQGDSKVMYIDAHQTITKGFVTLPKELHGRMISVVDKSLSFTLHTDDKVMAPGLTISVSGTYGYAIIKLT